MLKPQSLKKNTFYLYLLTATNYLFGFITVPYQTRVLGPEYFGILGFASAISVYFNLVLDFGFLLSGTKRVNEAATRKENLNEILSNIIYSKFVLFAIVSAVFFILTFFVPQFKEYFWALLLYLIVALLNSLLPDYLYRGLENMSILTYRAILTRGVFTVLIFILLKEKSQYLFVPISLIMGSLAALAWTWLDVCNNLKIHIVKTSIKAVRQTLKESSEFFLSRIATTVYNGINTLIIGYMGPIAEVGLYSSGTKFRVLLSQAESPICDSMYPYMTRTKDFKKMFKVTAMVQIAIMIFCAVLFIWAKEICIIVFGYEFADAAFIVRLTVPIMALGFIGKMFGFPGLTPLGLQKWANLSNVFAMINQLIVLCVLFAIDVITIRNLILVTIMSEYIGIFTRIIVFIVGYRKFKIQNNNISLTQ